MKAIAQIAIVGGVIALAPSVAGGIGGTDPALRGLDPSWPSFYRAMLIRARRASDAIAAPTLRATVAAYRGKLDAPSERYDRLLSVLTFYTALVPNDMRTLWRSWDGVGGGLANADASVREHTALLQSIRSIEASGSNDDDRASESMTRLTWNELEAFAKAFDDNRDDWEADPSPVDYVKGALLGGGGMAVVDHGLPAVGSVLGGALIDVALGPIGMLALLLGGGYLVLRKATA